MLNKAALLGIGLKTKSVKLETGTVLIQEFTTADREKFEVLALGMRTGKSKNFKSQLIAISVMGENGSRMFGDTDIDQITQLPTTVTQPIFDQILVLNGMDEEAEDIEVKK